MVVDAKTGQTVFVSAPLPSPDPSVGWALNAHDDRGSRPEGASAVPSLTGREVARHARCMGRLVGRAGRGDGLRRQGLSRRTAGRHSIHRRRGVRPLRGWRGPRDAPRVLGRRCAEADLARCHSLVFPAWLLAYVTTALVQSLVGSWSSAVSILRAMGSDDGRLAHAGPVLATVILARACLLAPVGEELLFRGALFTWLRQRLSAPWTIAITSALFALIHGFPQILPLAFALGVAAGWVRERSGSTIPTIVAHVVNNVLMVGFSYWSTGWSARLPSWQ
jgi:membrane protease YdiL (CAAX protease family)